MGKRAQKHGEKAPSCPLLLQDLWSQSSHEELDDNVQALIARVEALEKEKADRAAGGGDGGSVSTVHQAGERF